MDMQRIFSGSWSFSDIHPTSYVAAIFLLAYPAFTSDFFTYQIFTLLGFLSFQVVNLLEFVYIN